MKEIIVKLTADHIKVKGAEYVRDLVRCGKCANKDECCDYCHKLERNINPNDFCSYCEVRDTDGYRKAEEVIRNAPTIEPKRGEWIVHKERTEVNDGFIDFFPTEYECSNCGLKQSMYFINSKPSNFCPNCGADMRKGADDERHDI